MPRTATGGHGPRAPRAILHERHIAVPMRDGVRARADVWRPVGQRSGPAILMRTPYGREGALPSAQVDVRQAADRGYAVVVQDCRGRGASEGEFEPYVAEAEDGSDTIEWIADQAWCDGRVVMAGTSYLGLAQWYAASTAPEPLKAIAPALAGSTPATGWTFRNGVPEHGFLWSWVVAGLAPVGSQRLDGIDEVLADPRTATAIAPWSERWLTEPEDAGYWRARTPDPGGPAHDLPALVMSGWYDIFVDATLRAHARGRHPWRRMIIGPWGHDALLSHLVGDRNLGAAGNGQSYGVVRRTLDFYDAVLAGRAPDQAPVAVYVLGRRAWATTPSWPPPAARKYDVGFDGGRFGAPDHGVVPSVGGRGLVVMAPGFGYGPRDQRPLTGRGDVLPVLLPPLDDRVLAGPVVARLRVEPDAAQPQRDWVVTLCMVCPDGRWDCLTEGIARVPGEACDVAVPLGDVCLELPRGARLAVVIAGSSFPRWRPTCDRGQRVVHEGSRIRLTLADL